MKNTNKMEEFGRNLISNIKDKNCLKRIQHVPFVKKWRRCPLFS